MKIIAINIVRIPTEEEKKKAIILSGSTDFSSFSFFQKNAVEEFCMFFSRTFASRVDVKIGTQTHFEKNEWNCYVHPRSSGIVGVLIADKEYPSKVAFTVLYKCVLEFEKLHDKKKWKDITQLKDNSLKCDFLTKAIKEYQDPTEADDLMKIQKDIKEIKTIMNQCLEDAMRKGEKLDNLVKESGDLSFFSKKFYTDAASNNKCCLVM